MIERISDSNSSSNYNDHVDSKDESADNYENSINIEETENDRESNISSSSSRF